MTKQEVMKLLRKIHSVVKGEENGSAEHITEWISSEEVQEAIDFLENE